MLMNYTEANKKFESKTKVTLSRLGFSIDADKLEKRKISSPI